MSRASTIVAVALSFALPTALAFAAPPTQLTTVRIAGGFTNPVWVGPPPGDEHRLFVVEQKSFKIKIIKDGHVLPTPFLDLTGKVVSGSERGLLSMAFHPAYDVNGFFYVNYTRSGDAATIVERYQVSAGNPDVADSSSGTVMLGPISQPFSNHNGGNLVFGPDGYLYIGMGDGGSGGDPNCNAQKGNVLLGKLLRIDVDNGGAAPPSNPFISPTDGIDDRIWAVGVRNPWRFSFDRETHDLWIGEVGQDAWEEIDFVPASSTGGENYGWKMMEGNACFGTSACPAGIPACNSPVLTDPVYVYGHGSGSTQGNSVTGGVVYRGCAIPDLRGTYFFADYVFGRLWSFKLVGGTVTNFTIRTSELDPPGASSIGNVSHFGEDVCGEILIVDYADGEIYKIVPAVTPPAGVDLGQGKVGGNGLVPELRACGLLDTGNTAELRLTGAPANKTALLFGSLSQNPVSVLDGTLVPAVPAPIILPLPTDANGELLLVIPGGGGPLDLYVQYVIDDPGATFGAGFSNAVKLQFQS